MKFSYNWLKELSGTKKTAQELADLFMIHSFEVENVENLNTGLENVVIGKVLDVQKHKNADKLNVAKVDIGKEKIQIVCGAPNLKKGQKVPVACVGAHLPNGLVIKKSNIRNVTSNGMICAEDEVGVGTDHKGIMVLDENATVGTSFAQYIGRNDEVLDIDILPNRGHDCLSHYGVANEIRALEKKELITFSAPLPQNSKKLSITINTPQCNRYIGVKIENIRVTQSPLWIQARLRAVGLQPINNIVDITNYIMLETGQPLHAFDAHNIMQVSVRQAKDNESLTLLDDTDITLCSDDIVITDGDKPIALAGVMGGKSSAITENTTTVILESASFEATNIRFTQRRYNLQTDAAYRFERNLDPNIAQFAVARAITLFEEVAGAEITALTDIYPKPVKPWTVILSPEKVVKLLGVKITKEEIEKILHHLSMHVKEKNSLLLVTVPTIRLDLQTQEDLIEEIGRIYGYNKIKPKPLTGTVQTPVCNEQRFFERVLKNIFVFSGFDEVRSYSFYAVDDARAIGLDDEKHIFLLNPANPEQAIMRRTLMPHLLHFAKKNFSYFDRVQIFEIGRVYDPTNTSLPDERLVLGALVASKNVDGSQFFELKGAIEALFARINIGQYYFDTVFDENTQHIPDLHPSRRALIKMQDGTIIGWIGEITKKSRKYFGLKRNRAVVCELSVDLMMHLVRTENFFEPLAKYPLVTRDISMIVDERMTVADVERIIYLAGGDLIKDVDLFDLYTNEETGERSMAFHIVFGASDHTLTTQEIDKKITAIYTALEDELNVSIKK